MKRKPSQRDIVRELQRQGLVPISGGSPCTPLGTSTAILGLCNPQVGEVGWDQAWYLNNSILDSLFIPGPFLKPALGGFGFDASVATNGQVPIGNGSGFTLSALTPGAGIVINNSAGGIEIASSGSPTGGSIFIAGSLMAPGSGDYTTTSATYVDVDATNLKASVNIPVGSRFLIVWAFFSMGGSVITDGLDHVRIFPSAGSAAATGCFVDNSTINPVGVYSFNNVVANPAPGAQTIALQFRGDGTNAFRIFNRPAEGIVTGFPVVRARFTYLITN